MVTDRMDQDNRLIPALREAVDVVKMIFFKRLRSRLEEKYPEQADPYSSWLAGAVINELFGTPNREEPFLSFARSNRERVDAELAGIAEQFADLRIPLTDALRTQFLCDSQEGRDSSAILNKARELGVLLTDRELPLPGSFMELARRLGAAHDLLVNLPQRPPDAPTPSTTSG